MIVAMSKRQLNVMLYGVKRHDAHQSIGPALNDQAMAEITIESVPLLAKSSLKALSVASRAPVQAPEYI